MNYVKLIIVIFTIFGVKNSYAHNSNTPDTQTIFISDLNNYGPHNKNGFYYKSQLSKSTVLHFRLTGNKNTNNKYKAIIKCSGPFRQNKLYGPDKAIKQGQLYTHKSSIYPDDDLYNFKLQLNKTTGACTVQLKGHSSPVVFFLKPEVNYIQKLKIPNIQKIATCNNSNFVENSTPAQTYFHQLSGVYTSCSQEISSIVNLPEGLSAFQEKVKALLGQEISYNTLTSIDQDIRVA